MMAIDNAQMATIYPRVVAGMFGPRKREVLLYLVIGLARGIRMLG